MCDRDPVVAPWSLLMTRPCPQPAAPDIWLQPSVCPGPPVPSLLKAMLATLGEPHVDISVFLNFVS